MSRPDRVAGQRAEAPVATISPLRRGLNRTLLGLGLALVGAGLYQGGASLSAQQVERLTVLGDVRHIDAEAIQARLAPRVAEGFGWIPGDIVPIQPSDPRLKIPQMGWNTLTESGPPHPVLAGLEGEDG